MAPTKTVGALLALLVVATGAAAAMPGNAPADAGAESPETTGDDAAAEKASDDANTTQDVASERGPAAEANASVGNDAAGERGPPSDMPGPVPDFVSELHSTIGAHLDGSIDNLGAAVSDITPGDESETNEMNEEAEDGTDDGEAVESDDENVESEDVSEETDEQETDDDEDTESEDTVEETDEGMDDDEDEQTETEA